MILWIRLWIIFIIISLLHTNKDGDTALHYGAYNGDRHNGDRHNGDRDVVGLLLEAGADINAKNNVSISITCIYQQIII